MVNFHALTARRIHNLPDMWMPFYYKILDNVGYELMGAVPIGTYSRGPRKGRPKYPPRKDCQTVCVTYDQMKETVKQWEIETGLCGSCQGSGKKVVSSSVANGSTYRECGQCGGTGSPQALF